MQKITPCLWFDNNCEEAINHYIDTFEGSPHKAGTSKVISIQRYEKGMETPGAAAMEGRILTAIFELAGQRFMALDGGPVFKFNEAVSFEIECKDQEEVDYFWDKLSAVPESEQCGWCKDQFGLVWQIIPARLGELLADPDREKAHRVLNAMLKMKKINVAELEKAYKGA
jgi:predicted 3-demethylubiquinone-9 3-methyltransferase (glyoxalase superfamily)